MCILGVALCVAVFNFEMGLARYSKLNDVVRSTWLETSASDPETGLNTDLFITKAYEDEELTTEWTYLGKQKVVDGKYIAYGKDVYGNGLVVNGEVKMGDRISIYYKPDDPLTIYQPVDYTIYIIMIAASVVVAVVLIIICRLLNKSLKENTFSESLVNMMDIPMAVIVVGFILAFFAGMFIGRIQVNASYTAISQGLAEMYANHELTF